MNGRQEFEANTADRRLITDWAGPTGIVVALPCLALGLPSFYAVALYVFHGTFLERWGWTLGLSLFGAFMCYMGVGFLTYAQCTWIDRAERRGAHWIRFIHRWQTEEFKLTAKSHISIWKGRSGDHKAMLKTARESILLFHGRKRERVVERAQELASFLGITFHDS